MTLAWWWEITFDFSWKKWSAGTTDLLSLVLSFWDPLNANISTYKTERPPPFFSGAQILERGSVGSGPPNQLFLRGNTQIPPNISQTALLGGGARRRRKVLGFGGPLKCDSLRGKRSKRGPKSEKMSHPSDPPSFRPIWARRGGGRSVLYDLYMYWLYGNRTFSASVIKLQNHWFILFRLPSRNRIRFKLRF